MEKPDKENIKSKELDHWGRRGILTLFSGVFAANVALLVQTDFSLIFEVFIGEGIAEMPWWNRHTNAFNVFNLNK